MRDSATDLPWLEIHDVCELLTLSFGKKTVPFTMDIQGPIVTITRNHEGQNDDCTATFDFDRSEIRFVDFNVSSSMRQVSRRSFRRWTGAPSTGMATR